MYVMKVDNKRVYIATPMSSNEHPNKKYHRLNTSPGYELKSDDKASIWIPAKKIGTDYQEIDEITFESATKFATVAAPLASYYDIGYVSANETGTPLVFALSAQYEHSVIYKKDFVSEDGTILSKAGAPLYPLDWSSHSVQFDTYNLKQFFRLLKYVPTVTEFKADLSLHTFGAATNFEAMFEGYYSLTKIEFVTPIYEVMQYVSGKGTQVADMTSMFEGCSKLTEVDLSTLKFNKTASAKVTNMFNGCTLLTKVYVHDQTSLEVLSAAASSSKAPAGVEYIIK